MAESKSLIKIPGGLIGLLGIIFIILKLVGATEVATWSWWWVLAPFWIGYGLIIAVLLIFLLIMFLAAIISAFID